MTPERFLVRAWEIACGLLSLILLVLGILLGVWTLMTLAQAVMGTPHP